MPRDEPLRAAVVVPCFNESGRLHAEAFLALARRPATQLLFVDDGSRDATFATLEAIRKEAPETIAVLPLRENRGKGEAVRLGLLRALEDGVDLVGYLDADLSTSVDEMYRLVTLARTTSYSALLGSRIRMLGTEIQRSAVRHSFGRMFATAAAAVLGHHVYDTQCGAKVFRRTPMLLRALATPFVSRWTFDVELIGRLTVGTADVAPLPMREVIEIPLHQWEHASGSKFGAMSMVKGAAELITISRALRKFKATRGGG